MDIDSLFRKESIVFTTIDVIHEFGIQGISTKEIARRQGISEGTIFKHFPKKNDLLLAVLEHFSLFDHDIFQTTRLKKMTARESILFYIDSHLIYYENYPAVTSLTQVYDVLRFIPELEDTVKRIYGNRMRFIREMIREVGADGNPMEEERLDDAADIIHSTWNGICLNWRIHNCEFSLREKTIKAVIMLLDAFHFTK